MYIPMVRERVRIAGRRGIHIVVFADYRRCNADLQDVSDRNTVIKSVPFQQLMAVWEGVPEQLASQGSPVDQGQSASQAAPTGD